MGRKKVSIIVIAYNVEPYIRKCLDSLVQQTLDDIEILVIESASTDGTSGIVDEFASKFPDKLQVMRTPKLGLGNARNTGLLKASGDFIGFVDSDDWVEKCMFEKMYARAIADGSDLVLCDYQTYVDNSIDLPSRRRRFFHLLSSALRRGISYHGLKDQGYGDNKANCIMSGTTAVWNKLFRRDLIEGRLFYEDITPEDYGFTISSIINAKQLSSVEEVLYHYRVRDDSTLGDMRRFKADPFQIFESIGRARDELVKSSSPYIDAFDDRAVQGLFNWNIEFIHRIEDSEERRRYATRWARALNQTLPGWYDRRPIQNWSVGVKRLDELVECYRHERFDHGYDELVREVSSPPYRICISFLRSISNLALT